MIEHTGLFSDSPYKTDLPLLARRSAARHDETIVRRLLRCSVRLLVGDCRLCYVGPWPEHRSTQAQSKTTEEFVYPREKTMLVCNRVPGTMTRERSWLNRPRDLAICTATPSFVSKPDFVSNLLNDQLTLSPEDTAILRGSMVLALTIETRSGNRASSEPQFRGHYLFLRQSPGERLALQPAGTQVGLAGKGIVHQSVESFPCRVGRNGDRSDFRHQVERRKASMRTCILGLAGLVCTLIVSGCSTPRADFMDPAYDFSAIDSIAVTPVLDLRVDKTRPLNLDAWVHAVAKRDLKVR